MTHFNTICASSLKDSIVSGVLDINLMFKILRMQFWWNLSESLTWRLYFVYVSQPYNKGVRTHASYTLSFLLLVLPRSDQIPFSNFQKEVLAFSILYSLIYFSIKSAILTEFSPKINKTVSHCQSLSFDRDVWLNIWLTNRRHVHSTSLL